MEDKAIKVTSSRKSKAMQREALYSLLATEEEYTNLSDYFGIDADRMDNLSRELSPCFGEAKLATPQNVMQILQYDIQGYTSQLIAKQVGIEVQQVYHIRQSDAYKLAREEVLKQVITGARKYMEVSTIKAVKTLVQCLDSKNEKVKLTAAQDILNRAGLGATQQIEITGNMGTSFDHFSDAELAEIMKKESIIPQNAEVIEVVADTIIES